MSRHLKSYAVPKSWTLLKKINKWTVRPLPGAHPFETAMPVSLLLRKLGLAKTTKEIKTIVNDKKVLVDGKLVKDHHHSIGFMDVVQIMPKMFVRGTLDKKGRLIFKEISQEEAKKKACKIIKKLTVSYGKIQIGLLDGRTLLTDKKVSTGDTLVIEVPGQKVIENINLAKGALVFLIGGRHKGNLMHVEAVEGNHVKCTNGKDQVDTLKEFVVVVGKDKPMVTL